MFSSCDVDFARGLGIAVTSEGVSLLINHHLIQSYCMNAGLGTWNSVDMLAYRMAMGRHFLLDETDMT